ncbi:MAG: hypothetical protein KAS96_11635 [Planctomycetes bacterium]|nr:hypothetical protein [Planctomycetota bacterium]
MEMNQETAAQQLEMINEIKAGTKRVVTAEVTCKYLIMWGMAWSLGYVFTHLYITKTPIWFFEMFSQAGRQAGISIIWGVLMGAAGVMQWLMVKKDLKSGAVRPTQSSKSSKQMFWFWMVLGMYSFAALAILSPRDEIQINSFMVITIMFAYVMMGIWGGEKMMIWLGLIITVNTLIGYFAVPANYYSVWMAVMAGGVLFGAGIFGKIFWAVKS